MPWGHRLKFIRCILDTKKDVQCKHSPTWICLLIFSAKSCFLVISNGHRQGSFGVTMLMVGNRTAYLISKIAKSICDLLYKSKKKYQSVLSSWKNDNAEEVISLLSDNQSTRKSPLKD